MITEAIRAAFEAAFDDTYDFLRRSAYPDLYMSDEANAAWCAWQAATLAERERAAKVCDQSPYKDASAYRCAAAIRSGK